MDRAVTRRGRHRGSSQLSPPHRSAGQAGGDAPWVLLACSAREGISMVPGPQTPWRMETVLAKGSWHCCPTCRSPRLVTSRAPPGFTKQHTGSSKCNCSFLEDVPCDFHGKGEAFWAPQGQILSLASWEGSQIWEYRSRGSSEGHWTQEIPRQHRSMCGTHPSTALPTGALATCLCRGGAGEAAPGVRAKSPQGPSQPLTCS